MSNEASGHPAQNSASPHLAKPGPTVVGIGASAGGLAALKTFFRNVPSDTGLAFVIVVHLSPDHESHLAELLQPHISIPVLQVTDTTPIEPNHVYVIPPDANLSAIDTHLRLTKLEKERRMRAPIDHFFRTLAATHDGHGVGVVLTGTGSDGTLGIRDIKANGGLVIVQDPNEAAFDGMPQSAIATGIVDRVLTLEEIPEAILRFDRTEPKLPLPKDEEEPPPDERVILQKVLSQLRARTDRDFSRYKRSTVLRRIARRMQLTYLEDMDQYLEKLREQPEEARALADDLLITVTSFFRDPEVFAKLEKDVIPGLFEKRGEENSIRVWSTGCATGEEAYSLAILLAETAPAAFDGRPEIQVFASDLHRRSLEKAREGFYPGDISADVTPERLSRFFHEENGGYRIRKEIRDMVVFTPHNLLADPPFSRLDLISCRNLLIYLDRDVQRDAIELFHYALNPSGTLLLGSAESLEEGDLFRTVDKKLCLFQKRNVPAREPRLPVFPLTRSRFGAAPSPHLELLTGVEGYGALHQKMLERGAPPSVLVGPDNRLAHLSENAGRYLLHPGGEPTVNVLRVLREELRIELQELLQKVRSHKRAYSSRPVLVQFNGHATPVVMNAQPGFGPNHDGFALIIFEERELTEEQVGTASLAPASERRVRELEGELSIARQRLQAVIEEYEASQEEMKASNEEMQSTNEELRSTLEELETSKEELQSINEELQTVNQQNRHKVEELAQLTGDLQNLLAATDIATLFLDRSFRILRFTPKLGDLFNIRVTDRGRPISDLTHRLGYNLLLEDATAVLSRLVPVEREVRDDSGRWYLTRVLPYRSAEDRIDGVVITFIDIDRRKRMEVDLLEANAALLRANADLKHFSYGASHDIQEPLRTMSTHCEVLSVALDSGNEKLAADAASHIREGAQRMGQLLKDMLAYIGLSEYESLNGQPANATEALDKALEQLKETIQINEATVTHDALPMTRARESFMIQLFQNLIGNGIKYRSEAPPRIHVSAERIGSFWQFGVTDNGIGIASQHHHQIFDIFRRLHGREIPGSGVGLAICQRIVDQYGGRIWVESEAGKGCTISFTLPAVED